jgi:HSP20 family protein
VNALQKVGKAVFNNQFGSISRKEEDMAGALAERSRKSLMPWSRRGPLRSLREEMQDLMDGVWGSEGDGWLITGTPSVDLSETDDRVEVKMDLPGIKANEIDIQVNGNVLTVSGERKEEKEEKGKTFHRVERRFGSYSRSVTLPCVVQDTEAAAEYRDGVLTITLPKSEEAKTHKIKVKG